MAVLGHRQDVVAAAGHRREVALALADLSALEEIDAAEVVQRLVDDVLVAQHSGVAVTAGVQAALCIESDRDVLGVILRPQYYRSTTEVNDAVSGHIVQQSGLRNQFRLDSGAKLWVSARRRPHAAGIVPAPAVHHRLGRFSLGKSGHAVSAVLAEPVALGHLHHSFELFVGHLAAAFAARLRRNGEGTIHLPYSMCDTRGHNRHKERASPRPQPAYKSYSVSPSAISVAAHGLPRFPDSPYRSMQI